MKPKTCAVSTCGVVLTVVTDSSSAPEVFRSVGVKRDVIMTGRGVAVALAGAAVVGLQLIT